MRQTKDTILDLLAVFIVKTICTGVGALYAFAIVIALFAGISIFFPVSYVKIEPHQIEWMILFTLAGARFGFMNSEHS
jgi:hypothetical protein